MNYLKMFFIVYVQSKLAFLLKVFGSLAVFLNFGRDFMQIMVVTVFCKKSFLIIKHLF